MARVPGHEPSWLARVSTWKQAAAGLLPGDWASRLPRRDSASDSPRRYQ
jgi:hypothetical protein